MKLQIFWTLLIDDSKVTQGWQWVSVILGWTVWQYRLWSFQARGAKLKDFCVRINISEGNYWILSFGLMASGQK